MSRLPTPVIRNLRFVDTGAVALDLAWDVSAPLADRVNAFRIRFAISERQIPQVGMVDATAAEIRDDLIAPMDSTMATDLDRDPSTPAVDTYDGGAGAVEYFGHTVQVADLTPVLITDASDPDEGKSAAGVVYINSDFTNKFVRAVAQARI